MTDILPAPPLQEEKTKVATSVPQQPTMDQKITPYCLRVILYICLGSTSYGYAASIIATTLSQPSFIRTMHLDTATNANSLTGAMNGVWFAGGVIGAIVAGWVSANYGRKLCVSTGLTLILISAALLTGSVNAAMFIVFRFFNGWG